ncbi:hypothetical protein NYV54_24995 [Escherichia coli]|nr:hypothetical protein [Escherichia coli]MCW7039988.1 hypothetical protein [Escherichia coli]
MKTLDIRVAFSAVDRLTRPAENARRLMGQLVTPFSERRGDQKSRASGAFI